MSWMWGFLLCCMAGFWLCVADQGTPSSHVRYRHSAEHRLQRSSRKHCDPTYNNHTAGAITQQCGSGQYKERKGPYRGHCVPCNCNGLSHECDPNTGKCQNCQLNTAGNHCERCAEGYYGSAALRTCQVCPCPFSDPSHRSKISLNACANRDIRELAVKGALLVTMVTHYRVEGVASFVPVMMAIYATPLQASVKIQTTPALMVIAKTLLEDLEEMDSELYTLKVDLESFKHSSDALAALRKLEEAIIATKLLVMKYNTTVQLLEPKVKELETDVDGVRKDLRKLKAKADLTSSVTNEVLNNLDKTQQQGQNLLMDTEELLRRIEELQEQLKASNITAPSKEIARMLEEARQMVAQMRRQSCSAQRRLAEDELREAQRLLDYIMKNLTVPLNGTLATAYQTAQDLMSRIAELKDLEDALKKAERTVNKTKEMNDRSEASLSHVLKHHKMLEEEQEAISSDVAMSKGTLRVITDVLIMMEDLRNDFAQLAAELDGAEMGLKQKLDELSRATAKEGLVREAEEHAQNLMDLAMYFQMSLLNYTNTSAVHKAVEAINAYGEVTDALKKAEAAANEAHEAADQAFANVKAQNLTQKAEELKNSAVSLLDKAEKAEKNLTEATQKYAAIKDRLDKAKAEGKSKNEEVQAMEEMLNEINRDDIHALVNQAKDSVQAADNTVSNATTWLKDISDELDKIRVPGGDSNMDDVFNSINKTLNELNNVFPELTDTLAEVENQSSQVPTGTNMSDSIMRIKDMIEKTRDLANRIRGPILFSGNSHIELRPPKNLEDLRAFTAFSLTLHRPKVHQRRRRQSAEEEDNLFVLYLGNKNTQKDYVSMVVKNSVLYCVYKLGGIFHEIKTSKITESSTNSSFMDRVDFRRVYQDAEVIYTKTYTSSAPEKLPPMTNQANTTVSLLDLDRDEVVLYVGGYPNDFTPPKELKYPKFRGCIEFSTLNEHILGLYNFQNAVNIANTDRCLRGKVNQVGQYFDGTGYGRVNVADRSKIIKFFVLSRQDNALLFFMGKKDAYFTVTVEEGFVVLRISQENQIRAEKSNRNVFPVVYYYHIQIVQSATESRVDVTNNSVIVLIDYESLQSAETEAFVGGVPAATAVRHNISYPPFRGCLQNFAVDIIVQFTEEVGIVPGCPVDLLGLREASLEMGGALSFAQNITQSNAGTMVSLGFKSTQSSGFLLHTGNVDSGFKLSLVGGHVEMTDSTNTLKSKHRYDEGGWHYVTAFRNSTGMELNIDNSDIGEKQAPASATEHTGVDIVLGQETFQGCLRNFYMRRLGDNYIPADLSSFNQTGLVSLGSCKAQHPPLSMTEKSSFKRRGTVHWPNVQKDSFQSDCIKPAGLIQAYHLSASSQLLYPIQTEDLNFRPHFSLDVQTRSANGLLLHIADNQGVSRVVLFIASGRVKLSVGEGGLLHYQKKINNGDWHNIRFSIEQHTAHLVVDGFRVPDGQLQQDEGISMGLQAPVYIGSGQVQTLARSQGKPFPKESVIGCIRDVRFYDLLVGEPAVNHGGAPCFDGAAVEGAYFAGDGSYAVLEKYFMLGAEFNLTFEVRPRKMTGLLFHCRGHHGHSLSVFLKKAEMVVQMNEGAGDYSTSVTPLSPLCDHTFHHVKVTKNGNSVKLTVGKDSNSAVGPSVHNHSKAHNTLYIGGIPEMKHKRVPVWSSFVGCMRKVQINQAAVSFESVTSVFGPVNTSECPGD
ncbi:hypothetical protein AOLI_G00149470 [Acnodon oligacanthus]